MLDRRASWRWLTIALALVPPIILASLIRSYSVNVPLWDQWEPDIAGIFAKYASGHLTLGDLLAQHNEARLFFPRILFLVLGELTHWNVRYEMAATFCLACVTLWMIYQLEKPALSARPGARLVAIFLTSMLIFSPAMYEGWLWGLVVICYFPMVCILGGLLVARLKISRGFRIGACAGLAVLSSYSFGNGFLAWILLFPALFFWNADKSRVSRRLEAGLWLAGFVASETFYFHGYQHPAQHRPLPELALGCLEHPVRTAQFFFAFFGSPLVLEATNPLPAAMSLGGILILAGLILIIWIFRLRSNRAFVVQTLPWLVVGGYSILSGGLATVTRSSLFGASEALSSRYGIFAVMLLVALVHLLPIVAFEQLARSGSSANTVRNLHTGLGFLAAGLIMAHCLAFPAGVWAMRSTWQYRLMGKSCLAFIHVIPEPKPITELLYPKYDELRQSASTLQTLGLLRPPPFLEYPTNLFRSEGSANAESLGRLESVREFKGGNILFSGWALAPSRAREADSVLLTYERTGGEPRLFHLMDDRVQRPDLVLLSDNELYNYVGWQAVCNVTNMPKGQFVVKAWVYDSERQAAWLLDGAQEVDLR